MSFLNSTTRIHWRSVRSSLTRTTLLTLVHVLVVTKVNYCSSVLSAISGQLLQRLQSSTPPLVLCSFCVIAAAVQPGTVPVIVLFTIVHVSCVTDCNFNIVRCPCNGPVPEVSTLNFTWQSPQICRKLEQTEPDFVGDQVVDTGLWQSLVGSV